jgi:Family of unknown function (DUF6152)
MAQLLRRTMTTKRLFVSTVAAVLVTAMPVVAHHSANAEFDTQKVMTITGVLTKLEIVSPHSWWHLDVKGPDGKVTPWRLESNSPAGLIRLGVKVKTDVKVGETYSFRISPAWKDPTGEKLGWMRAFTINEKEYVLTEL